MGGLYPDKQVSLKWDFSFLCSACEILFKPGSGLWDGLKSNFWPSDYVPFSLLFDIFKTTWCIWIWLLHAATFAGAPFCLWGVIQSCPFTHILIVYLVSSHLLMVLCSPYSRAPAFSCSRLTLRVTTVHQRSLCLRRGVKCYIKFSWRDIIMPYPSVEFGVLTCISYPWQVRRDCQWGSWSGHTCQHKPKELCTSQQCKQHQYYFRQ